MPPHPAVIPLWRRVSIFAENGLDRGTSVKLSPTWTVHVFAGPAESVSTKVVSPWMTARQEGAHSPRRKQFPDAAKQSADAPAATVP